MVVDSAVGPVSVFALHWCSCSMDVLENTKLVEDTRYTGIDYL
jgi:hypothetical protein